MKHNFVSGQSVQLYENRWWFWCIIFGCTSKLIDCMQFCLKTAFPRMAAVTLNNFGIAKQTKSKVLRNVVNDQSSPSFRRGEGTLQETIIHFPVLFVVKYFPRRRVIKGIFLFSWKKAAAAVAAAAWYSCHGGRCVSISSEKKCKKSDGYNSNGPRTLY